MPDKKMEKFEKSAMKTYTNWIESAINDDP